MQASSAPAGSSPCLAPLGQVEPANGVASGGWNLWQGQQQQQPAEQPAYFVPECPGSGALCMGSADLDVQAAMLAPAGPEHQAAAYGAAAEGSLQQMLCGPRMVPWPEGVGKQRLRWSAALHARFVEAVQLLGGALEATPMRILSVMAVPGLTLYHVKSHLQKYRSALSDNGSNQGVAGGSGGGKRSGGGRKKAPAAGKRSAASVQARNSRRSDAEGRGGGVPQGEEAWQPSGHDGCGGGTQRSQAGEEQGAQPSWDLEPDFSAWDAELAATLAPVGAELAGAGSCGETTDEESDGGLLTMPTSLQQLDRSLSLSQQATGSDSAAVTAAGGAGNGLAESDMGGSAANAPVAAAAATAGGSLAGSPAAAPAEAAAVTSSARDGRAWSPAAAAAAAPPPPPAPAALLPEAALAAAGSNTEQLLHAALRVQMGMQRQLAAALEAQRNLQQQLASQGSYIQSLLRAEGSLPARPAGSSSRMRGAVAKHRGASSSRQRIPPASAHNSPKRVALKRTGSTPQLASAAAAGMSPTLPPLAPPPLQPPPVGPWQTQLQVQQCQPPQQPQQQPQQQLQQRWLQQQPQEYPQQPQQLPQHQAQLPLQQAGLQQQEQLCADFLAQLEQEAAGDLTTDDIAMMLSTDLAPDGLGPQPAGGCGVAHQPHGQSGLPAADSLDPGASCSCAPQASAASVGIGPPAACPSGMVGVAAVPPAAAPADPSLASGSHYSCATAGCSFAQPQVQVQPPPAAAGHAFDLNAAFLDADAWDSLLTSSGVLGPLFDPNQP